jgi:hypothetical protein
VEATPEEIRWFFALFFGSIACFVGLVVLVLLMVVARIALSSVGRNAVSPLVTDRFTPIQVRITAEQITGIHEQRMVTLQTANVVRVGFAHDTFGNLRQDESWLVRIDDRDGASIWVDGLLVWPATVFGAARVNGDPGMLRSLVTYLLSVLPPTADVEPRVRRFAATGQFE